MQKRIKILNQLCINQIAAGEVVERPLSVVKELVENSLDAGAEHIEITVEGNGTALIRVRDDGSGIAPEELQTAVLPHATSKISHIEDLDTLATLGFRGEALPSIASVSRMEIVSRTADSALGARLSIENSEVKNFEETGCPKGTTVTIRDLFYTTPARYKFLKSQGTEFGLISDMVSKLALTKPAVRFILKHAKHTVFMSPGDGSLRHVIASVMGSQIAQKLVPVSFCNEHYAVSGYLSMPDLTRNNGNYQVLMINGRIIRSKQLRQAVKNSFHTLIPHNTYPIVVLNIELSPSLYDVNVHPSKMEIKFKQENELMTFLTAQLNKAVLDGRKIERIDLHPPAFGQAKETSLFLNEISDSLKESQTVYARNKDFDFRSKSNTSSRHTEQPMETVETLSDLFRQSKQNEIESNPRGINHQEAITGKNINDLTEINTNAIDTNINHIANDPSDIKDKINHTDHFNDLNSVNPLGNLRALGQIMGTYILATDDQSLYIIDQHAAHERITVEKLYRSFQKDTPDSQLLLLPITLTLSVHEEQIVLSNFELFRKSGFILEQFGDRTYLLRGVPLIKNLDKPEEIFLSFIDELMKDRTTVSLENIIEKWIFTAACRNSIKGNDYLSIPDMQALLFNLSRAENPYTCPHGRPVIIEITQEELTKNSKGIMLKCSPLIMDSN